MACYRLHVRQAVCGCYLKGTVRAADITLRYVTLHYVLCEYKGLLSFFNFCCHTVELNFAVRLAALLAVQQRYFAALRARRPTVRSLCVVLSNLKTVASGLVWYGTHPTRLWIRDVVTECSNRRWFRDWDGIQGHDVTFGTSYHLSYGRDIHTHDVCLGNDSMID
jgi:hypothetical protein